MSTSLGLKVMGDILQPASSACCSLSTYVMRSMCLDLVQTSMETGITTGRRTIWLELSDTQESMMEIMSIMSPCCWQTSTKSECLKADDTKPICAFGWPPNEPQQPCNIYFYVASYRFCHDFQRHFPMNSSGLSSLMIFFTSLIDKAVKLLSPKLCAQSWSHFRIDQQQDKRDIVTCYL